MKRKTTFLLSLVLATTLCASSAFAQTNFTKGNKTLEGTFNYTKSSTGTTGEISPTMSYFVSDRFALGLTAQVSEKKSGGGIFGRCIVWNQKKTVLYSQLTALSMIEDVDGPNGSTVSTRMNNVNLGLGLNYFFTKKLAVTTSISNLASYTMYPVKGAVTQPTVSIGFNGITNPLTTPAFGILYKF